MKKYYLLQAKRLYSIKGTSSKYDVNCGFNAVDLEQEGRIKFLKTKVGNAVKYMLYCSSPAFLPDSITNQLSYLRNSVLSEQLFDYLKGLKLYKDLAKKKKTLAAGIFITETENNQMTLAEVHQGVLNTTMPLSWFLSSAFLHNTRGSQARFDVSYELGRRLVRGRIIDELVNSEEQRYAKMVVEHDERVIEEISSTMPRPVSGKATERIPNKFKIFPKTVLILHYFLEGEALNDNILS